MQMIDVLKRLAELDANNPNVDSGLSIVKPDQSIVVKEDAVAECGMMPEMGMGAMTPPPAPSLPASINMTAGSGDELSDILKTIMTLAGMQGQGGVRAEPQGDLPPPAVATTGDETPSDSMRNVIDKLNPADDGDDGMSADQGDVDNDGDHDMDDHDAEDDKEETDETVDSMGADPTDKNEFDANQFAHRENQPGQGDRMDGNMPKGNATFESLMKEYKQFIGEADEEVEESDDDMEEGIEDRLKDLDPKNPVNIPAYQRKAASGDSASAAKNTRESANESMADILKLSGLK